MQSYSWGEELLKGTVKTLNDAHQRMVTLAIALLGGSAVFLDQKIIDTTPRAISLCCFFITFALSLWGASPYGVGDLCISETGSVKEFVKNGITIKSRLYKGCSLSLVVGLIVAVLGVVLKKHS